MFMDNSTEGSYPVIVFGTANQENILKSGAEVRLGGKHTVVLKEFVGGSGVNYALRLLAAGCDVFPVIPVGNDGIGHKIREKLLAQMRDAGVCRSALEYVNSDDFWVPDLHTPCSNIVVQGLQRTVFAQEMDGADKFREHLVKSIDETRRQTSPEKRAVIIGHIPCDSGDYSSVAAGECTKYIVDAYGGDALVYANFGTTQIALGIRFWEETLASVDVFQLNMWEAKRLFSIDDPATSLQKIVQWLRKKEQTAVITLGRLGAIGIHKDKPEMMILACPIIDIENIVDTTGAGDAFAAGMVSRLRGKPEFTYEEFYSAVEEGCLWAAYACTTYGASGDCPGREKLKAFAGRNPLKDCRPMEIEYEKYGQQILTLIENAY